MAGKFSDQEIQECIQFHKNELGKVITKEEAIAFLEHQEEMDVFWQDMADLEWQMEQAHHQMGLKKPVK